MFFQHQDDGFIFDQYWSASSPSYFCWLSWLAFSATIIVCWHHWIKLIGYHGCWGEQKVNHLKLLKPPHKPLEPGTNLENPLMVGIIGYRYLGGYHWLSLVASSLAGECGRRQGVIELWEVRVINWALTALPDQKRRFVFNTKRNLTIRIMFFF